MFRNKTQISIKLKILLFWRKRVHILYRQKLIRNNQGKMCYRKYLQIGKLGMKREIMLRLGCKFVRGELNRNIYGLG